MKKKLLILGGIGAASVFLIIYFSKSNRYKRCNKRAEKIIDGVPTTELFDSNGNPASNGIWNKYMDAKKNCDKFKPESNIGEEIN